MIPITRISIFLLLLVPMGALFAQSTPQGGIRFFNGKWTDVLAEAKKTNRLIFVDVYTSWCIPCKKMEQEIFPLKNVGERYNAKFVNYRVDAEKGEGIMLKKKYNADAYPMYLFIDQDGILIHKGKGYNSDPEKFISIADEATRAQAGSTVADMDKQYAQGDRNDAFIRSYIKKLGELKLPARQQVLDEYVTVLARQEHNSTEDLALVLMNVTSADSKAFDFLLDRQAILEKRLLSDSAAFSYPGSAVMDNKRRLSIDLSNVIIESIIHSISEKDTALFKVAQKKADRIHNKHLKFPYTFYVFKTQYYQRVKDTASLLQTSRSFLDSICKVSNSEFQKDGKLVYDEFMQSYIRQQLDSTREENFRQKKENWRYNYVLYVARTLDLGAKKFHEFASSQDDLDKAVKWSRKAVELYSREPDHLQTLALLHFKLGQKQKAKEILQDAIRLAENIKYDSKGIDRLRQQLDSWNK